MIDTHYQPLQAMRCGLFAPIVLAATLGVAWSQSFVEVSGQTTVFSLAAGSTAAWNAAASPVTIEPVRSPAIAPTISYEELQNGLVLRGVNMSTMSAAAARLRIYDVRGKKIFDHMTSASSESVALPRRLAIGRYFATLSHGSLTLLTQSFTVVR